MSKMTKQVLINSEVTEWGVKITRAIDRDFMVREFVALIIERTEKRVREECEPKWISVEERLPEPQTEVWVIWVGVIDHKFVSVTGLAYLKEMSSGFDEWRNLDGEIPDADVTHWMPLPEAPKKKAHHEKD